MNNIKRPAEAALLDDALKRQKPRMSVRKAAAAAGISEGWWRQITKGVQSRGTGSIPVVAPAETIARMAATVGVTAEELEAAGRSDAAEVLPAIEVKQAAVDLTHISDRELAAEFLRRMEGARNAVHQTPSSGTSTEEKRQPEEVSPRSAGEVKDVVREALTSGFDDGLQGGHQPGKLGDGEGDGRGDVAGGEDPTPKAL